MGGEASSRVMDRAVTQIACLGDCLLTKASVCAKICDSRHGRVQVLALQTAGRCSRLGA